MLNSFPQRQGDPELLLRTFVEAMRGFGDQIVVDTAKRFVLGEVAGQSLTFAPSVAEFTNAARELVKVRVANGTPMIRQDEIPREPINARIDRVKRSYEGRACLASGIDHMTFAKMVQQKELPPDCEFVGLLGAAYQHQLAKAG